MKDVRKIGRSCLANTDAFWPVKIQFVCEKPIFLSREENCADDVLTFSLVIVEGRITILFTTLFS